MKKIRQIACYDGTAGKKHNTEIQKGDCKPSRIEIQYTVPEGPAKQYQLGCYTAKSLFGAKYQRLDSQLDAWKQVNPDKKIVWEYRAGHQSSQGNTQSLYFIFTL